MKKEEHVITTQIDRQPIWPELLQELKGVVEESLKLSGVNNGTLPVKITLNIAKHMGGMQIYFPRGDKLQQAVRDIEIYEKFNGKNIKILAREYGKTDKTIYEIIARMRKLNDIDAYKKTLFN